MADILIRGMEMPKMLCGEPCFVDIRIFADGKAVMAKGTAPYYQEFAAVPLPEKHGRLIDADELDKAFTSLGFDEDWRLKHFGDRKNWCLKWSEIETLIANAPTIVPAQGGKYYEKPV